MPSRRKSVICDETMALSRAKKEDVRNTAKYPNIK